jgi:hypothetical protein
MLVYYPLKLIKMDFKHQIKRFLQKIAIKYLKTITPKDEINGEFEKESLSICKNLISKENSKLLISPISKKRYIKNDEKKIFIIIESTGITIVNHNYSYNITLGNKSHDRLILIFDNEVERRRTAMELEIKSNVKHSLSNIYNNLINENF